MLSRIVASQVQPLIASPKSRSLRPTASGSLRTYCWRRSALPGRRSYSATSGGLPAKPSWTSRSEGDRAARSTRRCSTSQDSRKSGRDSANQTRHEPRQLVNSSAQEEPLCSRELLKSRLCLTRTPGTLGLSPAKEIRLLKRSFVGAQKVPGHSFR